MRFPRGPMVILLTFLVASCNERAEEAGVTALQVDLAAVEDLRIGAVEGDPEYLLGDVVDVMTDSLGRVYVADRSISAIRVYDRNGVFLKDIGQAGEGPGEFGTILSAAVGPDDRLYVLDRSRISIFATDPGTGLPGILDETLALTGMVPARFRSRSARVGEGRFYYPFYQYRSDGPPTYAYLVLSTESATAPDTLHVPSYQGIERTRVAYYRVSENTGRMVDGLSAAPFEPVPSWDVTVEGTVVGGPGQEQVLHETNPSGDTVRTITFERNSRRVSDPTASDSMRALRARLDDLPVPTSEVAYASSNALSGQLPEMHPAFIGVQVGTDGTIWVELSHEIAGSRIFDMLSPDGERVRTVELRVAFSREHRIEFRDSVAMGVVVDEGSGVESVVRAVLR